LQRAGRALQLSSGAQRPCVPRAARAASAAFASALRRRRWRRQNALANRGGYE
jgi:hypothetical protein